MRDAGIYAAIADRPHDWHLRRIWGPPEKRHPALAGTRDRAEFEAIGIPENIATAPSAQLVSNRRASDLDRAADALLFLGRTAAAERLAHHAAQIREVAA